jgi:hypothetical protein
VRSRSRASVPVAGGVALSLLLVACATSEPVATPVPTPTFSSTFEPAPATALAPLTGEIVELDSLDHPSIAAKIDNHPQARPQLGLQSTDIVFEELVEGGLTRYVAIWHSTIPSALGPVRSIRPMDPDIVSPFRGIIAYSGGQPRFVFLMKSSPVYNAIHGQPDTRDTFYRADDRPGPHDVLVRAKTVVGQHSQLPAPGQQFAYSLDVPTASKEGKATSRISLRFGSSSAPSWKWSEKSGLWLRSQSGVTDKDSKGKQLSAVNVVVVRVPVSTGLGVPKTELVGSGTAWVSTGGATIKARWSKGSPSSRISLVDSNGVVVRLAPGNTWIELVPTSGSASFK